MGGGGGGEMRRVIVCRILVLGAIYRISTSLLHNQSRFFYFVSDSFDWMN